MRHKDFFQGDALLLENKPAAQAAGADPSQLNTTNMQNLPLH